MLTKQKENTISFEPERPNDKQLVKNNLVQDYDNSDNYFFNICFKYIYISSAFVFLFICLGCSNKEEFKIARSNSATTLNNIENIFSSCINEDLPLDVTNFGNTNGSEENLILLESGKVQFAIAQNPFVDSTDILDNYNNIRVLLPLYKQVLLIIYPDSLPDSSLKKLLVGKRIGLGPEDGIDAKLMMKLFSVIGIDSFSYTPVYSNYEDNIIGDNIDVSCSLTGLFNLRIKKMLQQNKHLKLFDFDPDDLAQKERFVDGICMKIWTMKPYIIPSAYFTNSQPSIATLSVSGCLYGHKDLSSDVVYSLVEYIANNRNKLIKQNASLIDIDPSYSDNYFYQLHEGAIQYRDKDKPSYMERNAEVFALVFSMFVFMSGAIPAYGNARNRIKKNRLDRYYSKVLRIEKDYIENGGEKDVALAELNSIRNEVYDLMIKEKICADENFNIFLKLLESTLNKLTK